LNSFLKRVGLHSPTPNQNTIKTTLFYLLHCKIQKTDPQTRPI